MLQPFSNLLKTHLSNLQNPRPFVCDGNPLLCQVFIVGINAATEMNDDFWQFWSNENGFNKDLWIDAYIRERMLKPLAPNKTRRNKLSNTRQRIEWITEALQPIKVLETNLFVKATPTAPELKVEDRHTRTFEFLVSTIKPKVIYAHGKEVAEQLQSIYGIDIAKNKVNHIEILGEKIKIIAMNHLSRGWSKQQCIEIGNLIKQLLV